MCDAARPRCVRALRAAARSSEARLTESVRHLPNALGRANVLGMVFGEDPLAFGDRFGFSHAFHTRHVHRVRIGERHAEHEAQTPRLGAIVRVPAAPRRAAAVETFPRASRPPSCRGCATTARRSARSARRYPPAAGHPHRSRRTAAIHADRCRSGRRRKRTRMHHRSLTTRTGHSTESVELSSGCPRRCRNRAADRPRHARPRTCCAACPRRYLLRAARAW